MKAEIFTTGFGGTKRTHCNIIIEEITISNPVDAGLARQLTDRNHHNEVRLLAKKYTDNRLFHELADRIDELVKKKGVTEAEQAEHQALVAFTKHFKINYGKAEG